jgi:hypothetical protein
VRECHPSIRKYRAIGSRAKPAASYAARAGACPGVATGLDDRDVHATALHVLGRVFREPGADSTPLIVRVDAHDVDDAHTFVECIQCDGNESDGALAGEGHEDVPLLVHAARSDGLGLARLPVGMQATEDPVAEDFPNGAEDGCPCAKREPDDGVEVPLAELADLNRFFGHGPP